jgi:hypothetical protein
MMLTTIPLPSRGLDSPRPSRRTFRPTVEELEGRLVLSFSSAGAVPVGTNPQTVATADFNRDGNQDFAVANPSSKTVSVRLGDGLGGFVAVPTGGSLSLLPGRPTRFPRTLWKGASSPGCFE